MHNGSWRHATKPASSAIHRRNPRPRNVIAPKAGLLACGSTRRFRPSRASCKSSVARNGTATRRLQLRGQRRTLPQKAPPASRLSPAIMPDAGNLDRLIQHFQRFPVKHHIKISLYDAGRERAEKSACCDCLRRQRRALINIIHIIVYAVLSPSHENAAQIPAAELLPPPLERNRRERDMKRHRACGWRAASEANAGHCPVRRSSPRRWASA